MTLGDFVVLTLLSVVVFLIIFIQMRNKKRGKSSCNCSHCEKKEFCQKYKTK